MARDRSEDKTVEAQSNGAAPQSTPTAVATPPATVADSRTIMITDPDTNVVVRRTDYIRKCWVEKKMSRGAIAKHLTELALAINPAAKKIPYQAVFAVIKKGTPGGPDVPVVASVAQPQTPAVAAGDQQS